jgi:hypothetical protein
MATGWDEGGREFGIYRNGKVIGKAAETHGWGNGGGTAVTANGKYIFVASSVSPLGTDQSGEQWPPKGTFWFGVGRRKLNGDVALFVGGKGHGANATAGGQFMIVNSCPQPERGDIKGLAASETRLFVSNPKAAEIAVYDIETMTKTASWSLPNTGHIAYDPRTDTLWIMQEPDGARASIVHFTTNGKVAGPPLPIPAGVEPSALCVAPDGRVIVADKGRGQQLLIYSNVNVAPTLATTFGDRGGIYSGTPGRVAPLKLSSPRGIGVDAAGNIYVASYHRGAVLESYTPAGKRNWEIHSLEFTECADIDPASPNDVYTGDHHYRLYLAKPSGADSTYLGYLVNKFASPNDPRLAGWGGGTAFVRRLHGKLFLFTTNMNAGDIEIYRFTGNGEFTAPASIIVSNAFPATRPPANHPTTTGWIWRDTNGDGSFDASKFEAAPSTVATTAFSIDSRGDIWQTYGRWVNGTLTQFVRRFPLQGIDKIGNPIYTFQSAIEQPAHPLNETGLAPTRMQYVAETDTMYFSGFDGEHKNEHRDWKTSGPVIACYDHWTTSPSKRWQIVVPWESVQVLDSKHISPDAFSVAGNRLFNGYLKDGEIRVYNTADGSYLGSLFPGPEVDKTSGWIDTMYGVRANRLASGEYLIFAEEVWHEKVLMYRLTSPD